MESNKIRYKALSTKALDEVNRSLLLIATRKREKYTLSTIGTKTDCFGWLNTDHELADATAVLARCFIDLSDIEMLPMALLNAPTDSIMLNEQSRTLDMFEMLEAKEA